MQFGRSNKYAYRSGQRHEGTSFWLHTALHEAPKKKAHNPAIVGGHVSEALTAKRPVLQRLFSSETTDNQSTDSPVRGDRWIVNSRAQRENTPKNTNKNLGASVCGSRCLKPTINGSGHRRSRLHWSKLNWREQSLARHKTAARLSTCKGGRRFTFVGQ